MFEFNREEKTNLICCEFYLFLCAVYFFNLPIHNVFHMIYLVISIWNKYVYLNYNNRFVNYLFYMITLICEIGFIIGICLSYNIFLNLFYYQFIVTIISFILKYYY